jgi:hypothetical protein
VDSRAVAPTHLDVIGQRHREGGRSLRLVWGVKKFSQI